MQDKSEIKESFLEFIETAHTLKQLEAEYKFALDKIAAKIAK